MPAKAFTAPVLRAARLSRVPGVTIDAAARRFRVAAADVKRARREASTETALSQNDLLLCALTREGRERSGELGDLRSLASYLDYVNHDGTQPKDVRSMLDALERDGVLAIEGDRWKLLRSWP